MQQYNTMEHKGVLDLRYQLSNTFPIFRIWVNILFDCWVWITHETTLSGILCLLLAWKTVGVCPRIGNTIFPKGSVLLLAKGFSLKCFSCSPIFKPETDICGGRGVIGFMGYLRTMSCSIDTYGDMQKSFKNALKNFYWNAFSIILDVNTTCYLRNHKFSFYLNKKGWIVIKMWKWIIYCDNKYNKQNAWLSISSLKNV